VAAFLDPRTAQGLAAQLRSCGLTFEAEARPSDLTAVIAGLPPDPGRLLVELGVHPRDRQSSCKGVEKQGPLFEGQVPGFSTPLIPRDLTISLPGRTLPDAGAAPAAGDDSLLHAVGELWLRGVEPRWEALHEREPRRVRLPGYPFERERHWVDPIEETPPAPEPVRDPASWLYRPVWKPLWPAPEPGPPASTLVFLDAGGIGAAVATRLREIGAPCATVAAGPGFAGDARSGYTIDPSEREDYRRLFEALRREGQRPERVLHLWSLDSAGSTVSLCERFRQASERGFYSLLDLVAEGGRPATLRRRLGSSR
jgi:hypothetical protein